MARNYFKRITAAHESNAAKMRALNEVGASTSEIADCLVIRYQHAYDVLLRAGQVGRSEDAVRKKARSSRSKLFCSMSTLTALFAFRTSDEHSSIWPMGPAVLTTDARRPAAVAATRGNCRDCPTRE